MYLESPTKVLINLSKLTITLSKLGEGGNLDSLVFTIVFRNMDFGSQCTKSTKFFGYCLTKIVHCHLLILFMLKWHLHYIQSVITSTHKVKSVQYFPVAVTVWISGYGIQMVWTVLSWCTRLYWTNRNIGLFSGLDSDIAVTQFPGYTSQKGLDKLV